MDYRLELTKIFKDIISKDRERIKKQIPNLLTLIRGTLAPILMIIATILNKIELAFIIIAISAFTDCIDGWFARKYNVVSEFGALLDTICDKLFTVCVILPIFSPRVHTREIPSARNISPQLRPPPAAYPPVPY